MTDNMTSAASAQAEVIGAHEGSVTAAAWHPAGHLLVSGSNDQMMRFWARGRPGDGPDQHQADMREQAVQEGALFVWTAPPAACSRIFIPASFS